VRLIKEKAVFQRDVFRSGRYAEHFNPEDKKNPFHKIYEIKKNDVVALAESLEKKEAVLDVGGGRGRFALAVNHCSSSKFFLTDISIDMLNAAKEAGAGSSGVKMVNADAHDLPYRDGSFDIVVGLDLVCHLEHPAKALKEFHRILKNRGVLILDSTNSNPIWALFYPRYLGINPSNWLKVLTHQGILPEWQNIVKHYKKREFYSFLNEAGFQINKKINYGPFICPKWHLIVSEKIASYK
jgi:glycogen(starch) synthase